jgi:hypothetical protein
MSTAAASTPTTVGSMGVVGWISIGLFVVTIGLLSANVGVVAKMAGSKDDWDTLKTQMAGSVSMCLIGSAVFAVALYLFVSQYDLGNLMIPMLISIVLSSMALGIGLSALSVAAITR